MGAAGAVRIAAYGIGRRRAIIAIVFGPRTLMLMQMVTKMLAGLARLMRAVRTSNTPGELECQCDNEQLKEAPDDHAKIIACFTRNGPACAQW